MINKLKCLFGFHNLYVIQHLFYKTDQIGCRNCKKMWGMNHEVGDILPWDSDLQELYFGKNGLSITPIKEK